MRKIAKVVAGITAAVVAGAAGALVACSPKTDNTTDKTGEAWGLSHGGDYIAYSKIVVNGDTVKELTLYEVELPTAITVPDDDTIVPEADKVAATVLSHGKPVEVSFYKTVSYGSVTMTYDGTKVGDYSKGYTIGEKTMKEYFADEANCKAYYEAVVNNGIKVAVNGTQNTALMSKATLSKEENGYWTKTDKDGNSYSRWKMNRDATVKYVKENGVSKLDKLTKTTEAVEDLKEDKEVNAWTDGTVVTGATWSDLNPATSDGYFSYAELILAAYNAAK